MRNRAEEADTPSSNVDARIVRKIRRRALGIIVYGYVTLFCCGLITIAGFSTIYNPKEILYSTIFLALTVWGIVLVCRGNRAKKLAELYPAYAAHIAQSPNGSVSGAAASMGEVTDEFRKNLSAMVKRGLFSGYIYDVEDDCIKNESQLSALEASNYFTVVRCTGCGATSKVSPGKVVECRYCGTHLSVGNTIE